MSDALTLRLIAAAQMLDWHVAVDKGVEWEFNKFSPAGEDFVFSVHAEDPADLWGEIRKYASGFDTEEHVKMWVNASGNTAGVPDIRTLLDDADDIKEMIIDLAERLAEITEEASE